MFNVRSYTMSLTRYILDTKPCQLRKSDKSIVLMAKPGFGSDYNALESVNPAFRGLMSKSAPNWLDLCQLVTRVCKGSERLFELPYDSQSYKGLGGLVKALFDSTLDKTYQVCDWRRRPMKPQQVRSLFRCYSYHFMLDNIVVWFEVTRNNFSPLFLFFSPFDGAKQVRSSRLFL